MQESTVNFLKAMQQMQRSTLFKRLLRVKSPPAGKDFSDQNSLHPFIPSPPTPVDPGCAAFTLTVTARGLVCSRACLCLA
jgi:hypothetical protein